MPRQVRIQFPGAVYHVLARGDRREDVFLDDGDRNGFLQVLKEACARTGWICHAYVLMSNHYHLVIETPEPNLVAGMSWLQNTVTRRHNVKHRLWGHLFGGRYKAVLVDDESPTYLPTLIDYVHLNPFRAGLETMESGLGTFPWSSLASAYKQAPGKRPAWVKVERGLRMRGFKDDAGGRRKYLEHLAGRAQAEGKDAGRETPREGGLQSTLKRGWALGGADFKEKLQKLAKRTLLKASKCSNQRAAQEVAEHGEVRAEQIAVAGLKRCRLKEADLQTLAYGDERKVLIALTIKSETTVPLTWIAERLNMGTRSTVSRETTGLAKELATNRKLQKEYDAILRRRR